MFNQDTWQEIFDTIKKNKLRTFLSGFTVAIGILIFIILYGLGNGLEDSFSKFFTDDQVNTIRVYPSKTSIPYRGFESNRQIIFKNSDLESKIEFKDQIEDVVVRNSYYSLITYQNKYNNYQVRAVSLVIKQQKKQLLCEGDI